MRVKLGLIFSRWILLWWYILLKEGLAMGDGYQQWGLCLKMFQNIEYRTSYIFWQQYYLHLFLSCLAMKVKLGNRSFIHRTSSSTLYHYCNTSSGKLEALLWLMTMSAAPFRYPWQRKNSVLKFIFFRFTLMKMQALTSFYTFSTSKKVFKLSDTFIFNVSNHLQRRRMAPETFWRLLAVKLEQKNP